MIAKDLTDQATADARRESRTNLFAMATIYTDAGPMPVKVRDLSATGALAEGPVLPPVGVKIRLCRGSLQATGKVAWCKEGRAGLKFENPIVVANWLPRGRSIAPQHLIDDMVHKTRASAQGTPPAAPAYAVPKKLTALDLMRLKQAIECLADDLGDDAAVVERYGARLQVLDLVSQTLRDLAIQS